MPDKTYNEALLGCQSECMEKDGMGYPACVRQCMLKEGWRVKVAKGGKKNTKTKKGNKRRKNKRTSRKSVK